MNQKKNSSKEQETSPEGVEKFKITITVTDKVQSINIESINGYVPSYQEYIGTIEIAKTNLVVHYSTERFIDYMNQKKKALKSSKKSTKTQQ